jgi:hypothetical protein
LTLHSTSTSSLLSTSWPPSSYVDPSIVETRDDFARFVSAVLADFRSTAEAERENGTLERFLDGLSAFAAARVVEAPCVSQYAPRPVGAVRRALARVARPR